MASPRTSLEPLRSLTSNRSAHQGTGFSCSRVAVVTGGNRGIGLAIVRKLALEYPRSSINDGDLLIHLTARDYDRGQKAKEEISADPELEKAGVLSLHGGPVKINCASLDLADPRSIQAFAKGMIDSHPDGIDIVINNAGVAHDGYDIDVVKSTLRTNYYGTKDATETLVRQLKPGGRMVNLSSTVGSLGKYPERLRNAFVSASQQSSAEATTKLMDAYLQDVEAGREEERGWGTSAYAVSKAACTAMTMAVARGEEARGRGVLLNACCPGYVNTDMTKGRGVKTVEQGARTPVMLALDDIGGQTGKFWRDEKVQEWA